MNRILINCSNLHGGGSAAVATSFISFLATSERSSDFSLLLSTHVLINLKAMNVDLSVFKKVDIFDSWGVLALFGPLSEIMRPYSTVFTIFGPIYIFRMYKVKHIIGFAQPWIIYPKNLLSTSLSFRLRIKNNLKYFIQSLFFRRADILLVELDHVKLGLLKNRLFKRNFIAIVHSEVDNIFFNSAEWVKCELPKKNINQLNLGVISRNYPHKNLKILPTVSRILNERHNINVKFYVTFSDSEWSECSRNFKDSIANCGSLTLAQCPSFYDQMDGIIFPSFLECFSATPIEAMVMKKPLFASDLPFIYDCCLDNCNYFNPTNADDIALAISHYFKDLSDIEKNQQLEKAYNYVLQKFPSGLRARKYLSVISE